MKYKLKKYPCEYLKICCYRKYTNISKKEKCTNEDYKECSMAKFYDDWNTGNLFIGSKK